MRIRIFALLLIILCPCISDAQRPPAPKAPADTKAAPEILHTAGDRPIDIKHILLDLAVDIPKKTVKGKAVLYFERLSEGEVFSLDAVQMQIKGVKLGNASGSIEKGYHAPTETTPVTFQHDGKHLQITLPKDTPRTDLALIIEYVVKEPKDGLFFFQPTSTDPNVPYMLWSQGESIGNRYWIPCLDHPGQKQTTEMIVTADDKFQVLSNGKMLSRKKNDDGTATTHWLQAQPHVSYLITLVVGEFAIVEEKGPVPLYYYVPANRKEDVARSFGHSREMMEFLSRKFGIAYPWEKYAQVVVEQFTSGGMENTSATTLTDRALLDERSAIDGSSDGLIVHEMTHQWWGDLVTCRDWAHIWLNEGFATFGEIIWAEHKLGREEADYLILQKARAAIAGGKERPIVDRYYSNPNAMFDARAYPKGAWVLHMLRARLGEDVFWKAIQAYGTEHRYQSVETSDFRRTCERVSGKSLERFFHDWTERPGHPVLTVKSEYQPDQKQLRIQVKQTQESEPFEFPLQVLMSANGKPITLQIKEREQTFFIPMETSPEMVVIDPAITLLAEIEEEKTQEWWVSQLRLEKYAAARIRALEHLKLSKTAQNRELLAKALKEEPFWGVAAEVAVALGASGGDISRDALLQGLKHSNPKVRRACAENLQHFPGDEKVAAAMKELLAGMGDPSYSVESAALRTYASLNQPDTLAVVTPWLEKPSLNDTLRSAALFGLGNSKSKEAYDTLMKWALPGKSRTVRNASMRGLIKLCSTANLMPTEQEKIVELLIDSLRHRETRAIRATAISGLQDLGKKTATKAAVVAQLQRLEGDADLEDDAREAAKTISKATSNVDGDVAKLREEFEKLNKQNQELRERLDRLEKLEKKTPASGGRASP